MFNEANRWGWPDPASTAQRSERFSQRIRTFDSLKAKKLSLAKEEVCRVKEVTGRGGLAVKAEGRWGVERRGRAGRDYIMYGDRAKLLGT